jgi:hypothetical protein
MMPCPVVGPLTPVEVGGGEDGPYLRHLDPIPHSFELFAYGVRAVPGGFLRQFDDQPLDLRRRQTHRPISTGWVVLVRDVDVWRFACVVVMDGKDPGW